MDWVPLEFLPLKSKHIKPLAICKLQVKLSYPSAGSQGVFYSWASVTIRFGSLYLLTSGDSHLPYDPSYLMNLRRVDFVCSVFSCCANWIDYFLIPYMVDQNAVMFLKHQRFASSKVLIS